QIKSAVTDTGEQPAGQMSEGVENLFMLIKASGNIQAHQTLLEDFQKGSLRYSDLKETTADSLWSMMEPLRERKNELAADKKRVKDQIKSSSGVIREVAQETVREVKELAGLMLTK